MNDVSACTICQTQKKQSKKYGLLPKKDAEAMPLDRLCINLIGPYNIKSNIKGVKIPPLKCITMINLATGQFEIKQYDDKKSITVTIIIEQEWLTCYLQPSLIALECGNKFIGQDFHDMCVNDYGIKRKVISTQNPKVNAIIKCMHQTLGNVIRSFQLQNKPYYDLDDPWGGILVAVAFAFRSMYHTTLAAGNDWPAPHFW
jgi:hypothetical protein